MLMMLAAGVGRVEKAGLLMLMMLAAGVGAVERQGG